MPDEIHMYMAIAKAATAKVYPAGECHPILILLRQAPGSEHDLSASAAIAMHAGWIDVDITKAGTLPADAADRTEEPFHSCHAAAVSDGHALLVYSAVVQPAPPKNSAEPPLLDPQAGRPH